MDMSEEKGLNTAIRRLRMAGLAALFTHDFFALARDKLNQGGIFVQFMHSYEMDWPTFSLVGRTFARVFPSSALVVTAPSGQGGATGQKDHV